jgi:hypothetical protein
LLSRAREGALGALPFITNSAGAGDTEAAAAARPFATRLVVPAVAVFTETAVLDALATVAARLRTAGAVAGTAEEASFDTALRRGRALRADPGDVTLNSS